MSQVMEMNGSGAEQALARPNADMLPFPDTCHNVPQLFLDRVARLGNKIAMRDKEYGVWQPYRWDEYGEKAEAVGLALRKMGLKRGARAGITAEVCPEWLFADLGIMGVGGISFGIYPTDAPAQIEYIMNNCEAEFYFAGDDEQLDKVLEVRDKIPSLKKIIVFDMEGLHHLDDPMVMSFDDLLEAGRAEGQDNPGLFAKLADEAKPEDVAILVYTSGTTGPPKGAMITHGNIMFQLKNSREFLPYSPNDRTLAFLPLCHIAERTFTTFIQLLTGHTVYFAENTDAAMDNLREVEPTSFFAVPRVWEKFYSAISVAMQEATRVEQLAYHWAMRVGNACADKRIAGEPIPPSLQWAHRLADFLVFANIRKRLGIDACRFTISGAAPISPELIRWYYAMGLYMAEGYGQTENAGLATLPVPFGTYKKGSIGKAVPNTEVKIAPDGEILVRGPHVFKGYWRNEEKTAETIQDGWLHTGDVGAMDNEGWFKITGRIKDIIITAGGKNITPSEIENELKFSPYIQDAVIIGDERKYLTALIMVEHDNVAKYAQDHSVPFSDFASLCQAEEILKLIGAEVQAVNEKFARVEQVKKFRLIEHLITPEDDEITATGKLKRSFVSEKYKELIDTMY